MVQSTILQDFYKSYYEWASDNAECKNPYFFRSMGLCTNLVRFINLKYSHLYCSDFDPEISILKEMQNQFILAGHNPNHPFNSSHMEYMTESEKGVCHLNQVRLKWVKNHI